MRASFFAIVICGSMLAGAPAFAQSAPAQPSVESYLCTFAGKCGAAETTTTPVTTREAPPTKGFSLARPQAAREAPSTKGFSLARPQSAKATESAPATRGFSMAQPVRAKTVPTTPTRVAGGQRPAAPRRAPAAVAAVSTPALGAAVAGRKADLMITFEMNSDKMTSIGESRARVFADSMLRPELLDKRFLIEGHTDSAGNRAANLELSRRRANAVANYLNAAGVQRSRLEVRGMGFKAPIPGHRSSDPANRRVEAELIS